jgi:pimeloyl-ACP methyl ester carboxylesterase
VSHSVPSGPLVEGVCLCLRSASHKQHVKHPPPYRTPAPWRFLKMRRLTHLAGMVRLTARELTSIMSKQTHKQATSKGSPTRRYQQVQAMLEFARLTAWIVLQAFADASGFAGVIRELESAGHTVLAPPNPLRGVAFDASVVGDVVKAIDGPVVLVGHSYGGAVITQASAGLENVTGLVFLAAFGLEVGESCASVQQPFPPPLLAKTAAPTPYDAPGAAGGPDLYVQKDGFRETFCADVPVDMADVMFATQRPLAAAALSENATAASGKTKPSWFLVSEHDNAISPERNGSWHSGWAPRPTPSTARTPRSSRSRSPRPR